MLKILQARLQQYVNHELPNFKLVLEKAEEPEIKLPISAGSLSTATSFNATDGTNVLLKTEPKIAPCLVSFSVNSFQNQLFMALWN